jgi:hypothetical protein
MTIASQDIKPEVSLLRKDDTNIWIFNINRNDGSEIKAVSVEFEAKQIVVEDGYQILHPVDQACDEPAVTDEQVILDENIYLLELDERGEYVDCEEYLLESDEEDLIISYIKQHYEF